MRKSVRDLLDEIDAFGNKDTGDLLSGGVGLARRAGFVTSRRIGAPITTPRRLARRQGLFVKLAWRHELTEFGRAAIRAEHRHG